MAKKAPAKPAPAKRKPRAKKPLTDELRIIKPVPLELISFNAGQVLSGGFLRKRLNLNGEIETYSLAPITIPQAADSPEKIKLHSPSSMVWSVIFDMGGAIACGFIGLAIGICVAGGIDVSPSPGPSDAVSAVFNTQEAAFRRLSGERAKALRAGELTTEKASADWMAAKYLPESDSAWATLLTAEAAAFGGEQWTAEKEAMVVGGYVR